MMNGNEVSITRTTAVITPASEELIHADSTTPVASLQNSVFSGLFRAPTVGSSNCVTTISAHNDDQRSDIGAASVEATSIEKVKSSTVFGGADSKKGNDEKIESPGNGSSSNTTEDVKEGDFLKFLEEGSEVDDDDEEEENYFDDDESEDDENDESDDDEDKLNYYRCISNDSNTDTNSNQDGPKGDSTRPILPPLDEGVGGGGSVSKNASTSSDVTSNSTTAQIEARTGSEVGVDNFDILAHVISYGFSHSLANDKNWTNLLHQSYNQITNFIVSKPKEKVTMKNILASLKPIIGYHLNKNTKKEEYLSLECTVITAFMQVKERKSLFLDMSQFLEKYPEFNDVSVEERSKLLDFCNCVRIMQCLIPTQNNKEHILDLTTRLTEGFAVRRITGTGMTLETKNRYYIIHKEGNIPWNIANIAHDNMTNLSKSSSQKSLSSLPSTSISSDSLNTADSNSADNRTGHQSTPKKKRGRPISTRLEDLVPLPVNNNI